MGLTLQMGKLRHLEIARHKTKDKSLQGSSCRVWGCGTRVVTAGFKAGRIQ